MNKDLEFHTFSNIYKFCTGHCFRNYISLYCTSLDKFKESIKSWIPDNCDCVLCRINVKGVGRIKQSEIFE